MIIPKSSNATLAATGKLMFEKTTLAYMNVKCKKKGQLIAALY